MIHLLFRQAIAKQETLFHVSLDYLRYILSVSATALVKFMLITPMARHRKSLSMEGQAVAALLGTRMQDCGPCVQITVNMALHYGVPSRVLQATLEDRPEELTEDTALVYHFAKAVLLHDARADTLRQQVRERWSDAGLIDIAFALTSAQVYPTLKRTLGFSQSCTLVEVEAGGQRVRTRPLAAAATSNVA